MVSITVPAGHSGDPMSRPTLSHSAASPAGVEIPYLIGTMIELPRACLLADEIAKEAQFFSFGTNDLTQTTFGISRDDAGGFLGAYVSRGILEVDPFISLDREGVGVVHALRNGQE
jgi:pyruvate,orthophosphate dikinase